MGFVFCVQIVVFSWILNIKYGFDLYEVGIVWVVGLLVGIIGQVFIGLISDNVWFWNGWCWLFIFIGGIIVVLMLLVLFNFDIINEVFGFDSILGIVIIVVLILDLVINISFNFI